MKELIKAFLIEASYFIILVSLLWFGLHFIMWFGLRFIMPLV